LMKTPVWPVRMHNMALGKKIIRQQL